MEKLLDQLKLLSKKLFLWNITAPLKSDHIFNIYGIDKSQLMMIKNIFGADVFDDREVYDRLEKIYPALNYKYNNTTASFANPASINFRLEDFPDISKKIKKIGDDWIVLDLFADNNFDPLADIANPKYILWVDIWEFWVKKAMTNKYIVWQEALVFSSLLSNSCIDIITISGVDETIITFEQEQNWYVSFLQAEIYRTLKPWWLLFMYYNYYQEKLWANMTQIFGDKDAWIWLWFYIYQKS